MMIQDTSAARGSGSVPSAPHSPSQHLAAAVIHAPPFPTHRLQNPSVCLSSRTFIHLSLLSQPSRCMGKEAGSLRWSPGKPPCRRVAQHGCDSMSLPDGNWPARQPSWLRGLPVPGGPCPFALLPSGVLAPRARCLPQPLLPSDCLFLS